MFELGPIKQDAEQNVKEMSQMLGLKISSEQTLRLLEAAMGKTQMELYRVANFYAEEADKCRSAEAYFSACLMLSSAIEAFLALRCCQSQAEVERAADTNKFPKPPNYERKILQADFNTYIRIASALDWVPSDVVPAELLEAAVHDFPLVASMLYAEKSEEERANKLQSFAKAPGVEMLRLLKDMRNLIHAPRWPRLGIIMSTEAFDANSKFVFVIGFQVMMCLLTSFSRKSAEVTKQVCENLHVLSAEEKAFICAHIIKEVDHH